MSDGSDGGGGPALIIGMVIMGCLGAAFGVLQSTVTSDQPKEVFNKQAPQTLVHQLTDPTEASRAGFKLLEHGKAAIPPLLRAAEDPSFPARRRAIDLLGQLRAQEAVPLLLKLDDPALAEDRLVALGRIQGPQALEEIRRTLRDPKSTMPLLFAALRAAANWEDPPASLDADVAPFRRHEVWGLREFVAVYDGTHKRKAAVSELIAMLQDDNASVRRKAAWALMQIKDPAGVRAVDQALEAGAIPPGDD